jgi:hypothetical protein
MLFHPNRTTIIILIDNTALKSVECCKYRNSTVIYQLSEVLTPQPIINNGYYAHLMSSFVGNTFVAAALFAAF